MATTSPSEHRDDDDPEREGTRELAVPGPYGGHASALAAPQTLSILSLVFGVVGLIASVFAVGLIFALAAVVLGHLALKREPAARSMAIAGLATGYAGIAISVVWGIVLLATVLIPLLAVGAFLGGGALVG